MSQPLPPLRASTSRRPATKVLPHRCLVLGRLALCYLMFTDAAMASSTVVDRLREVHRQRQGVLYAFGGCDETQMDCSCFVQTAFKDAFGRRLPRSTLTQTRFFQDELLPRLDDIRRLMPETLCPGDLIYTYRGGPWESSSRHVAIYFQHGRILHSARSVGVKIQPLDVLSHHQLYGVVRLFECRRHTTNSIERQLPNPSPVGKLPTRANKNSSNAQSMIAVRQFVDDLFRAWSARDLKNFASLWGRGALQWRESLSGDQSSVLSDWRKTFDELGGKRWRYGVRELQIRGDTAYVEVATEHACPSVGQRGCDKTVQTFVWRRDPDGLWRIIQHEIGSAQ